MPPSARLPDKAPRGYQPFRPVILWPELRRVGASDTMLVETRATEGRPEEAMSRSHTGHAAERRTWPNARTVSFFTSSRLCCPGRSSSISTGGSRMTISDDAKKAADDQDEIGLGQISKAPATCLKLHLDLAPEDVDREALSGVTTYPEWDVRSGAYLPAMSACCPRRSRRVARQSPSELSARKSSIRAVRRQFEALRPARISTSGHLDGDEH